MASVPTRTLAFNLILQPEQHGQTFQIALSTPGAAFTIGERALTLFTQMAGSVPIDALAISDQAITVEIGEGAGEVPGFSLNLSVSIPSDQTTLSGTATTDPGFAVNLSIDDGPPQSVSNDWAIDID
jgi:hypothetical protein